MPRAVLFCTVPHTQMDIEGWEGPVLRGGSQLLAAHCDNLLLEYSPGIFERRNMTDFAPQASTCSAVVAAILPDVPCLLLAPVPCEPPLNVRGSSLLVRPSMQSRRVIAILG